jgi:hypothetical protein
MEAIAARSVTERLADWQAFNETIARAEEAAGDATLPARTAP